jgi:photosystem II stability/assembly factor-like uncharacterized protein
MSTPRRIRRLPAALAVLAAFGLFSGAARAGVNLWTSGGPGGVAIDSLAIDPQNQNVLYAAGDQSGVFKSIDGGLTWNALTGPSGIFALAIDPFFTSTVYAAGFHGVFQTKDGGASWKAVLPSPPGPVAVSLAIDPADSAIVYAGTRSSDFPFNASMYESKDRGATWKVAFVDPAEEIAALLLSPQQLSTVYEADYDYSDFDYVGTSTVYASADGGANWIKTGTIPAGAARATLAVDPADSSTLFLGTFQGLYKSSDAGKTWSLASTDLSHEEVTALAIDPRHRGVLYAGTPDTGIYRSVDGGSHWSAFNEGLTSPNVYALAIDSTGSRLYAGTGGAGVFSLQIPTSGELDISVGPDYNLYIVAGDSDGRVSFQTADSSGNMVWSGPFGPYSGWIPATIARGADGLTRILFTNEEGSAALWLVGAQGNQASYFLQRRPGLIAIDVTAPTGGGTHVLWAGGDGRITISSVDNSGRITNGPIYGPFSGWAAVAAADGSDGLTRLLWRGQDGRTAISFARDGSLVASYAFAAVTGWSARDLAVGGDGLTRILWSNADHRTVALWIVDAAGRVTGRGPVYPAQPGMSAQRIASGPDGSSRVLFTDGQGGAMVWELSASGVFWSDGGFRPVEGSASGTAVAIGLGINDSWYAGEGRLDLRR